MANEKFTELPTVANATTADIIAAVQGGVSVQETLAQVTALARNETILNYPGDPNGNLAGTAYQLCYDTTNDILYICTTSGTTSTAVWTKAGSVNFPITLAEGGTGAALTADVGAIPYSTASAMAFLAATATANQIVLSGSNAAPTWSTATYPATTTANQLLYSSATNTIGGLTSANSALLYTNSSGVPAWSGSLTDGQLLVGNTGGSPTAATLTAGTNISITNGSGSITIDGTGIPTTIPVPLNEGGTNANLTADDGAIVYSTSSAMAFLASTATANQIVLSGSSSAPSWSTATYPATTTANQILYSSATNTISEITTANSAMLVTDNSGVPAFTGSLTDGQLIIGNSSATPTAATITAGSGIGIVNGSGTITISSTGGSGYAWNEETGTSASMAVDNGYIANNASTVTLTLPATAAVGDSVAVLGKGAGGWSIAQNAGQTIHVGAASSTTGAGGSVASTAQYDSIELVCITANTDWTVLGAPQGTLTVT